MSNIFISHAHSDHLLANAIDQLITDLFDPHIRANYSTKQGLEGAIPLGGDWFLWIVKQVELSDLTLIVVTPASIQKPWVIWEAGAAAGAAVVSKKEEAKAGVETARVIPLVYGVSASDLPDFFARFQVVTATGKSGMETLVKSLQRRFGDKSDPGWEKFYNAVQPAISRYLATVDEFLLQLPQVINEAAIQEWLERLADLQRGRRFSEAAVLENWMDVAFGREEKDQQRPIDIRIHRRLGELYAAAGESASAVRQFELAQRLVPRDIFVLRRLGKAYLDDKKNDRAGTILQRIEKLDPSAFQDNTENAALKARFCRAEKDYEGARAILKRLYESEGAYYLGDLLGQVYVLLGDMQNAQDTYRRVGRTLQNLSEHNVWTHATALNVALVLDDADAVNREVGALRDLKPTREQLESIGRGLDELLKALGREGQVELRLMKVGSD